MVVAVALHRVRWCGAALWVSRAPLTSQRCWGVGVLRGQMNSLITENMPTCPPEENRLTAFCSGQRLFNIKGTNAWNSCVKLSRSSGVSTGPPELLSSAANIVPRIVGTAVAAEARAADMEAIRVRMPLTKPVVPMTPHIQ